MHVWTHHRWRFPLPPHHKFPLGKYELLAERVVADGLVGAGRLHEADPVELGPRSPRCTTAACSRASARAA